MFYILQPSFFYLKKKKSLLQQAASTEVARGLEVWLLHQVEDIWMVFLLINKNCKSQLYGGDFSLDQDKPVARLTFKPGQMTLEPGQ